MANIAVPYKSLQCVCAALLVTGLVSCAANKPATKVSDAPPVKAMTTGDVIAASTAADWRPLDPANTLYLELRSGRVVIELAPAFAPNNVANIKALVQEKYFDGLQILRSQDNYVVQWGDPNGDDKDKQRPIKNARRAVKAEFTAALDNHLPFTRVPDADVYAPQTGFTGSMPAAHDPKNQTQWLTHCYGAVGVGRDNDPDSGSGSELYVVTGNAPRHLDRNVTVVGRVVQGMELLSTLPRGTAELGFYDKPEQRVPVLSIRLAADMPPAERTNLEVLRSDTPTFAALIESRRTRREEWFKASAGHVDVCNVPIPVRALADIKKP